MLKALELVGFKSFADKTRFEFPQGITAVVGPNGSGKSNVVDAIKWVLGEQSIKSLRGKEMADVIFNGAGAGASARRPQNAAEVTLTLDNTGGLLAVDSKEVHLTRRVYRGGEGEYLINRQPCRLKDIRELLSGTGMGTQAYSIIEQGKVDLLLQSSAKERRAIFEEAAGISRFKSKKVEAQRRLERVEQNLLRLSDIVDEVEARLRSVRLQAGKARRYKEYTDRLQELRTQVGLVDWHRLTERLNGLLEEIRQLGEQRDSALAQAEKGEAHLLELDTAVVAVSEEIRQSEARFAANRERIAARESTIEHERARINDFEEEIARARRQLAALKTRAGDLRQQMSVTGGEVEEAERQRAAVARQLVEGERLLSQALARLDHLRGQNQQRRVALVEQARVAAALGSQISALEGRLATVTEVRERAERRADELVEQLRQLHRDLDELHGQQEAAAAEVERRVQRLAAAKSQLAESQQQLAAGRNDLAEMRQRHGRVGERIAVLDEMEKRQEGLGAGVKEILDRARDRAAGPLRLIHGLVADLFQVSVETAPLIEVALGVKAQYVVATRSPELVAHLRDEAARLAGRVGFLWMDPTGAIVEQEEPDLAGRPGVLGRADRFVQCEPAVVPLATRLLGRTWIVESLDDALQLASSGPEDLNFVTASGELLAADGALVVGPRDAAVGLISRKSQLRALRDQQAELETRVGQLRAAVSRLEQQIAQQGQEIDALAGDHQQAVDQLAQQRFRFAAATERAAQLEGERAAAAAEQQTAAAEHAEVVASLTQNQQRKAQAEQAVAEMERDLAALAAQVERLENDLQERNRQATETKIELAKSEERLRNLRARLRQFEESQQERDGAIEENRRQLDDSLARLHQARWNVLHAESEAAELYLHKEAYAAQTVTLLNQRADLQRARTDEAGDVQKIRVRARRLDEKLHQKDLEAGEVRHERTTLASRLREDYQIELAELEHAPTEQQQRHREEVQREIDELRRKVNNLGNVNLEALEEIEQLESRYTTLSEQFKDLSSAKASLEKIIDRINADSKRLFLDTLETVRGHFQQIFRDLFGGGRADIVVEDPEDILESGIEIAAKPPGKELRSISLLSGGEKTLTCVALLLAVFRSRPSPFCVLDEVDAALDEANIGRFTGVLHDFLKWTQFIIITHSKKTMTCAGTIYGVTMQESGISKQVSVRFEDVSDTGEILRETPAPPDTSPSDDEQQAA